MKVDDIKKVTVIGSGTMGNGIAQVFASYGFDVTVVDYQAGVSRSRVLRRSPRVSTGSSRKGAITEDDKKARP